MVPNFESAAVPTAGRLLFVLVMLAHPHSTDIMPFEQVVQAHLREIPPQDRERGEEGIADDYGPSPDRMLVLRHSWQWRELLSSSH